MIRNKNVIIAIVLGVFLLGTKIQDPERALQKASNRKFDDGEKGNSALGKLSGSFHFPWKRIIFLIS